ncbi:1,4-dihydroxy-2-naphthoate octaprenyltransferase [Neisseria sp.]|uniref:1,4-dihydroxy-2-naphthoate octaprenyltransferase n=1 Tax=Neisseria sp. TaxID=192066 RepID=UPI0035A14D34
MGFKTDSHPRNGICAADARFGYSLYNSPVSTTISSAMIFKYWLAAARIRTLPLAAATVLAGCLSARLQGSGSVAVTALCVLTAVLLQIFANLANDYGDAANGADRHRNGAPPRMVGSGRIAPSAMKHALRATALLCCLSGISLLAVALPAVGAAGWRSWLLWLLLGAAAVAAAFCYTAGRKPYGYAGFGDLAVFVFFGLIAVAGSEFLHTGRLNPLTFLPASAMGLWCCMVLNLNNMRDIDGDAAAGKNTVAVRLGLRGAKVYHTLAAVGAALCWWLWLDNAALFSDGPAAPLSRIFLAAATLAHLYALKTATSSAALDRLLPRWSITVLLWTGLLWAAHLAL